MEDITGVPTSMCSTTFFLLQKVIHQLIPPNIRIGKLQYVSFTRPDITFTVNKLSQFMHSPHKDHLKLVKRLLKYLIRTSSYGVRVLKEHDSRMVAYYDSDWEGDPIDCTSVQSMWFIMGAFLFLGPPRSNAQFHNFL
ncbi:hypothetical protein KY284_036026 [Solanum tuberosum]|nr:hypothetical protein KY284_036026 [Solanum tuberosum]